MKVFATYAGLPRSAKEPGLAQAARARALHRLETAALGDKAPIGELRVVAIMFLEQNEQIVDLDEGFLGQFAAGRLRRGLQVRIGRVEVGDGEEKRRNRLAVLAIASVRARRGE